MQMHQSMWVINQFFVPTLNGTDLNAQFLLQFTPQGRSTDSPGSSLPPGNSQ
jgi:hypothetical protein